VGEEAVAAVVAVVAVEAAVEVVVENRNERADPLTKRLATRGNAALNLVAVLTPQRGMLRYPWLDRRQKRPKQTREIRDRHIVGCMKHSIDS